MAAAPCIQEELYTVVRSQCSGGIIFPSPSLPFHSLDGTTALPYTVRTYLPYRYAALVAWLRQGCQGFFLNYILPLNFSNFTFSKKTTVIDGCYLKKDLMVKNLMSLLWSYLASLPLLWRLFSWWHCLRPPSLFPLPSSKATAPTNQPSPGDQVQAMNFP